MGRARGPDSPPTIAQWTPSRSAPTTDPIKGSNDTNLTVAGVRRKSSSRSSTLESSTLVPTHTCESVGYSVRTAAIRSGRLVKIWYVCRGVSLITFQTRSIKDSGTSGWNRSDIEFTKTRLGLAQFRGASNDASSQLILPVHTARPPLVRVSPLYFSTPIALRRAAMRMA